MPWVWYLPPCAQPYPVIAAHASPVKHGNERDAAFLLLAHDQCSDIEIDLILGAQKTGVEGETQSSSQASKGAADWMEARPGTRLIQEASSPFVFRARDSWSHQKLFIKARAQMILMISR
jgi:hypothetical protein